MNDITLIIPAKNESESLPKVLDELKKYNFKINIILHSTDKLTINSIKKYNEVNIIYQKNFGYGDALKLGIDNCFTKYFCIFNADGSFIPDEINKMKELLEKNKLDIVFGSRYHKKAGSEDDTIITLLGNYFFSLIGKIFFKLNISDILYTFVLGKTYQTQNLDLQQTDFTFCVELPIKAKRNELKISSISSFERKRIAGKKKVNAFIDGLKILIYLVKAFFKKK